MSESFVLVLDFWRLGAFTFIQPSADATPLQDNATRRKRKLQLLPAVLIRRLNEEAKAGAFAYGPENYAGSVSAIRP